MTEGYRVRIFESELRVICDETLDFSSIETGGNLYGLLSHGGSPIVQLATRPAGQIHRGATSLELDHQVQQAIEESLWGKYGIQFLGMWHSHHQIGLYEPSEGDRNRTANYAVKAHRKFYVEILCNLPRVQPGQPRVVSVPAEQTVPDETADEKPADDEGPEEQDRRARRAQAKEEKRRARDAARESGHGAEVHGGRSGRERSAGPVRVAPFVYVDATRLIRADAEFMLLPGMSPVRTALMKADLPDVLADAFRPVSNGDICYELRTSGADRSGGRYHDHLAEPPAQPDVHEPAGGQPMAPGGARQGEMTMAVIPDMAQYVQNYVEPLLRTRPGYPCTLEPVDIKRLMLRIRDVYGRAELLLILGWDGAAPVVLSCAIRTADGRVIYPDRMDRHDMASHFYWGIKRL